MTDRSEPLDAPRLRALAKAHGLEHAYALFPDTVAAAQSRGSTSLGPQPADFSPLTEPAFTFDPATIEAPR